MPRYILKINEERSRIRSWIRRSEVRIPNTAANEYFRMSVPGANGASGLIFVFDQPKAGSKKVSVDELRKKEKECRRLKHELSTEKEKFNQMVGKFQADLQTLQVS